MSQNHSGSALSELFKKEDWWSVWIGLGAVAFAYALFVNGASLSQWVVVPAKWKTIGDLGTQLLSQIPRYVTLFVLFAAVFSVALKALGFKLKEFLPAFLVVFVASTLIFALGQWDQADKYNLEPPLVALGLGLLIANTVKLPGWLQSGLRVEFYVKVGIVLLGATLPFTLIIWAGPVAILQASIVSLVTFFTIFLVGTRFLGLDKRQAATLGAGGAVCGVSGSIAIAGAVGASKEDTSISISIVIFWAILFIFALPIISRELALPTGVAGAWIGTSEFADAAGFAAAQAYAGYAGQVPGIAGHGDAAVTAYTLMKVIGRDVWIGVWALVLSIVATTRWNDTGVKGQVGVLEIWRRFPKFVLGFLLASLLVTLITQGFSYAEYKKTVVPALVAPIKNLRTWSFIFCFLSIGLTLRFSELTRAAKKPFLAFTAGVVVNVILGYILCTQVFVNFWTALGE